MRILDPVILTETGISDRKREEENEKQIIVSSCLCRTYGDCRMQ
jgi:hypothetical protein